MRWSYKTVHYELKKEGLLGSSFLDESELEISLNEYGKAGWELISVLETSDGIIAVFKQSLGASVKRAENGAVPTAAIANRKFLSGLEKEPQERARSQELRPKNESGLIVEQQESDLPPPQPVLQTSKRAEPQQLAGEGQDDDDVGAIRIE